MQKKTGIPHGGLVLVGDGSRAVFLRNHGSPQAPSFAVENVLQQNNPPTREQGTDRPGRLGKVGSVGTFRNALEETDWHRIGEERFAAQIADSLYRLAHSNQFERLVIVAPPKVLGVLRKMLHKEVLDRVENEVPKELASCSVEEIKSQLASWW